MATELLSDESQSLTFLRAYSDYMNELANYLLELEQRLFSEGLHEIGGQMTAKQLSGYMNAVLEGLSIHIHTYIHTCILAYAYTYNMLLHS